MKSTNESKLNSNFGTLGRACLGSCRKLLAELRRTKQSVLREFRNRFQVPERSLELAMNVAEAISWETGFPQLFFPTLAIEKAQAAVDWQARQRQILAA